MVRSQWLVDQAATTTTVAPSPVVSAAAVRGESEVVVVGGTDGVSVMRREKRRPVLSGGFGR
jgi:hypothetical protein